MADTERSTGLLGGDSVLSYAATTLPVVQGALALIVISFVGQVWANISPEKHLAAFLLIYACGAHFIFSFFIAAPAALFLSRRPSVAMNYGFTVGIFAYTFWSLNMQHRALADLLVAEKWSIPLPFGDAFANFWAATLGGDVNALYFSPLLTAYVVGFLATLVFLPLSRSGRR